MEERGGGGGGGGGGGSDKKIKSRTEVDGYRGEGIHRNWISTAIISISVIWVQTVFQTGVWFCYKCSRKMSGSRGNMLFDFMLFFIEDYVLCVLRTLSNNFFLQECQRE